MGSAVKRLVAALFVALALRAQPAQSALLTHTTWSSTSTSSAINTTGATVLAIAQSTILGPAAVQDSASNTWTNGNTITSGARNVRINWVVLPTTNASHTFSSPSANANDVFAVAAFDSTPSSSFDTQGTGGFSAGTTVQPGSVTPGNANNLFLTALGGDAYDTISIDSGFSIADHLGKVAFVHEGVALGYLIQSSATAQNPTWTVGSNDSVILAISAVFKANSGGASTPVCQRLLLGVGC
jgi:hypothetical protein